MKDDRKLTSGCDGVTRGFCYRTASLTSTFCLHPSSFVIKCPRDSRINTLPRGLENRQLALAADCHCV